MRSYAKALLAFMIVVALAPSIAAAQAAASQSTTLLDQLAALQQELSALQATLASILGNETATTSVSSTLAATGNNSFAKGIQTSCSVLASYIGGVTSQACAGSSLAQQPVTQNNGDPVDSLLQALTAPPVSVFQAAPSSPAATAPTSAAAPVETYATVSYASLVNTSCSTDGATVAVTGGFSCIGICMQVPSSILECKSGQWQQQ